MSVESISPANNEINSKEIISKTNDIPDFNRRIEKVDNHDVTDGNKEEVSDSKENANPIYIHTRNESLEGDKHPHTGVPFIRKIVDTPSGEKVEGVFANFEAVFKAEISKELYLEGNKTQFKECNRQLAEKIDSDPDFAKQFTKDQIEQIRDGISDGSAPDGYVWHHEPESGVLSLVDSETHALTGHTGGRFIWGGGSEFSYEKGEGTFE